MRGDDERRRERRDDVTARAAQDVEQPEHRAERVPVGRDVACERDLVGAAHGLGRACELDVAHGWSSPPPRSARCRPRRISSTRWPCSMAGSSRKCSLGRYLRRTSCPNAARRCGAAERQRRVGGLVVAAEVGVEDDGVAQVGAHLDAGHGHHRQARVGAALELVGERLVDDLVDAQRAGEPAVGTRGRHVTTPGRRRARRARHARRRAPRPSPTRRTKRSTVSSTSSRRAGWSATAATPTAARCQVS